MGNRIAVFLFILLLAAPCQAAIYVGTGAGWSTVTAMSTGSGASKVTPQIWDGATWLVLILYGPEYHFFVARGQSNATGAGDSQYSPEVTNGSLEITVEGDIRPLADPVGEAVSPWSASSGSLYPAFANKYYELTGKKIILLHTTLGGSGLTRVTQYSPTYYWKGTGQLGEQSEDIIDSSIAILDAAGYSFQFMGQLWYQGESDYDRTAEAYGADLNDFFTAFINHYIAEWPDIKNYEYKMSTFGGETSPRQANDSLAASRTDTLVVWDNPYDYYTQLSTYPATQGWHLTQEQYNLCGETSAEIIAENQ